MCDCQVFNMAFNPLVVILKENKLDGTNYIDWKRNLDIVLIVEDYKFMLTDLSYLNFMKGQPNRKPSLKKSGLRMMRCCGVIFCLLCQILCNISISLCPQPMI